jgi:hypothetical protein
MTWWSEGDRYEVFFNRDELKTRARAIPPRLCRTEQGVCYLAPTDPDSGGSWMLVNEYGVTVSLLNRWHEGADVPAVLQSRGQLVLGFAGAAGAAEVIDGLRETDCTGIKPFTLVVMDREDTLVEAWDGSRLFSENATAPLVSSSYCFAEVSQARRDRYAMLPETSPEALRDYQAGATEPSAFTVRMNRPDAQTWSRSRICVGEDSVLWQYLEEAPDLVGESIEYCVNLDLGGES